MVDIIKEHKQYWSKTLRLTLSLLVLWFIASFGVVYFAKDLSLIIFFGWPLSFYMAAQGSLLIFLLIIWLYARGMDKLDKEYGIGEKIEE